MYFLCPAHRQQFTELPPEERQELWLFWMDTARSMIENGEWRDVVSLAGSSFDLACLKSPDNQSPMHIELTLSAILVSRVLSDLGEHPTAERIFYRALDALHPNPVEMTLPLRVAFKECVEVLLNRSRQSEFFLKYLNWRSAPFTQHRTYRVQVVH